MNKWWIRISEIKYYFLVFEVRRKQERQSRSRIKMTVGPSVASGGFNRRKGKPE